MSLPRLHSAGSEAPASLRAVEAPALDPVDDFEAVVDRYQTPLLRYVSHVLGRRCDDEAQDVVQETFLRLYRQVRKDGRSSVDHLSSWLFRVAHNLACDVGRQRSRSKRVQEQVVQNAMGTANQPNPTPPPLSELAHQEACQRALVELEHLNENHRQLLLLKIVQGMSLREISKVTGLTVGNAGYRINQALQELAQRLKTAGVM